jgi:methionine-rich copper-binding protein CopC
MANRSFVRCLPLVLLLCGWHAESLAHAACKEADPAPGSVLEKAPAQINLHCNSALEVAFSKVQVNNASGQQVDNGGLQGDPKDPKCLVLPLPPLQPGVYKVLWNVVARDGHKTKGDYTFTIR